MRRMQRTRLSLSPIERAAAARAVRRIVVDENNLPVEAVEKLRASRVDQKRNIGLFVEGRNDDREFRRGPHGAHLRPRAGVAWTGLRARCR